MVELIAINTIKRVVDGKHVVHAPGTRFEMMDNEVEAMLRMRAAVLANPQDVAPIQADVSAVQAPVQVQATVVEEEPSKADESPVGEDEIATETADNATKRVRKAKTETE